MRAYENLEQGRNLSQEMKWHPWIPDSQLTLTKIPNTIITCRLCRGSKYAVARKSDNMSNLLNQGELIPCPNCYATGIQKSTHLDELWGRNR